MQQIPGMPSDFTYDHFGNTKTKVSGGSTTNYIWDYESHLLSIDYPGTTNDDSHEYDGDGRRMRSKLNGATEWTNFVWDEVGGSLLAEYTLISGVYTVKALYTNGLGLISTNREGAKRYFHFDGLGSTWALTDENENVKDSYSYSAFGVTLSATSTNGPSTNPMRFVGRWGYYDDTAMGSQGGLSLLGVRYLSPSSGRFLTWDPIRSTNNYDYVRNLTTMVTDSTGTQSGMQYCDAMALAICIRHCRGQGTTMRKCRMREVYGRFVIRRYVYCECNAHQGPDLGRSGRFLGSWWYCAAVCNLLCFMLGWALQGLDHELCVAGCMKLCLTTDSEQAS